MSTLLSSFTSHLPQHPGILPQWLFFTGLIACFNSVQAYLTTDYTKRVYSSSSPTYSASSKNPLVPTNSPATPLSSRTFGTWTFLQGVVRMYAAYNIDNPAFYQLAFATYVIAWAHFTSEWFVFGTACWGKPLAGPVIVANASLLWMWTQWGFYMGY